MNHDFRNREYMYNLNAIDPGRNNIKKTLNPAAGHNSSGNSGYGMDGEGCTQAAHAGKQRPGAEAVAAKGTVGKTGVGNMPENNAIDAIKVSQARNSGKNKSSQSRAGLSLDFSGQSLVNGFILSEVLGRPKYLRKGRW